MRSLLRIIVLGLICAAHSGAGAAPLGPGDTPPEYLGQTLAGDPVNLSAFRGKAVVLTFWATWCPYCLKELPILENLEHAAGANLQVIAVNTEDRDTFRHVARALKTLKLKLAYDPQQRAAEAFGVKGIPHLVIIGRDGKIQAVYRGYAESSLPDIVADINVAIGATAKPAPPGAL